MAARRLLIVMLILLGLSTLAAALVPQHTLRRATTTGTTAQPGLTQTPTTPAPGYLPPTKIMVGGKRFPVVAPVHVGDQLTLLVASRFPTELSIQEFGQVAFAAPNAPARFELLASTPGNFGIQFLPSGKVAARIEVVPRGEKRKPKARSRARGGSGPA